MSALLLVGPAVAGLTRLAVVDDAPAAADVKPGWVALLIVLALCVVTALLWLNMRKQLGKISFEEQDTPRRRRGGASAAEPPSGQEPADQRSAD